MLGEIRSPIDEIPGSETFNQRMQLPTLVGRVAALQKAKSWLQLAAEPVRLLRVIRAGILKLKTFNT